MNEPVFALIGRASLLLRARATFYWWLCAASMLGGSAVLFVLPDVRGSIITQGLVLSIVQCVVYARIAADDGRIDEPEQEAPFDVVTRILERVWAVIVIDFGLLMVNYALGLLFKRSDAWAVVAVCVSFVLSWLLMAWDVSATVDEGGNVLTLIPRSLVRAIGFIVRAFPLTIILYGLTLGLQLLESALIPADNTSLAAFYITLALGTIITVPLSALLTVFYMHGGRARVKG